MIRQCRARGAYQGLRQCRGRAEHGLDLLETGLQSLERESQGVEAIDVVLHGLDALREQWDARRL